MFLTEQEDIHILKSGLDDLNAPNALNLHRPLTLLGDCITLYPGVQENMLTLVTDLHKLFLDPAHPEPEQTDAELATRAFREMDTDRDGLVTR